jgi:nucleotide-binding universal stress UspA family protein
VSGTIVLGYDGSPGANAALRETTELAPALEASVVVVFAYYISPLGGGDVRDYKHALERVGGQETRRAVADLEDAGITARAELVSGKPADAIMQVVEEVGARLVVVGGTEGESPLAGAILGSVVLRLVQRCPVPLVVVPAPS